MNPYYQDESVTLYHGDCREITCWMEADVLVTDPPYGRAWKQGRTPRGSAHAGIQGDHDTSARDRALEDWGTERPALMFGDLMLAPPNGTKQVGAYRKPPDAGFVGAMAGHRRDLEAIYWIGPWRSGSDGRTSLYATRTPSLMGLVAVRYRNDSGTGHPHTKPLDVMESLLAQCPPGVVADPFAGSGSTLLAAKRRGRKAIGVEIEERYCEVAAKRLAQGVLNFGDAS